MKFYRIIENEKNIEVLQIKDGDLPISVRELEEGIDLSGVNIPRTTLYYSNEVIIQDWASVVLPVISEKFKKLIESVNHGDAQFFPIAVEREDGKEKNTLYVLNHLQKVNAVNLEESRVIGKKGQIGYYVAVPSIIESKVQGLDIFRLEETGSRIHVSEKLAKLMKKNKISGIELMQVRTSENFFNK